MSVLFLMQKKMQMMFMNPQTQNIRCWIYCLKPVNFESLYHRCYRKHIIIISVNVCVHNFIPVNVKILILDIFYASFHELVFCECTNERASKADFIMERLEYINIASTSLLYLNLFHFLLLAIFH